MSFFPSSYLHITKASAILLCGICIQCVHDFFRLLFLFRLPHLLSLLYCQHIYSVMREASFLSVPGLFPIFSHTSSPNIIPSQVTLIFVRKYRCSCLFIPVDFHQHGMAVWIIQRISFYLFFNPSSSVNELCPGP